MKYQMQINPLILVMLTTILLAVILTIIDTSGQREQPYIWVHYDKDGKTVLGAGKINNIIELQENLKCKE
jgi:hypothetical protein